MKKSNFVWIIVIAILFFIVFVNSIYTINEGDQAVVIRLGRIEAIHSEAGLKFKIPFIDNVVRYSRKILSWDGEAQRLPTLENQFIWVDTTARWKITDPRKFYESIGTISAAQSRLDDVIDSSVRKIVSSNSIREAVRNSNVINEIERVDVYSNTSDDEELDEDSVSIVGMIETNFARIVKGRNVLSNEIFDEAQKITPEYGITLIDIVIRQIKYSDDLTESVYNRMIKERNQIAQAFRSDGEGKKARWIGEMNRELRDIQSTAYKEAETLRGEADAQAAAIYAQAYNMDAEFYTFWKSMESYRETFPRFNKTLTTDAEYFNYLYNRRGRN